MDPNNPANIFRDVDRVRPLPELRTQADDWTGVTTKQERKRRQNRLNQRAWRRRQAGANASAGGSTSESADTKTRALPTHPSAEAGQALLGGHSLEHINRLAGGDGPLLLPCTRAAEKVRNIIQQALHDHSLNIVRPSYLHIIIRLNILNAIADNCTIVGFPKESFCRDEFISPFFQPGPAPEGSLTLPLLNCPPTLHPTALQRATPHHPWIDLFPFPAFRDNVLRGTEAGLFDEDELCMELMGVDFTGPGEQPSLLVWTEAWDPRGWEVNALFVAKWGMLLAGCPEILRSTNYWRAKRGQAPLSIEGLNTEAEASGRVSSVESIDTFRTFGSVQTYESAEAVEVVDAVESTETMETLED